MCVLSLCQEMTDNRGMNELLQTLEKIGLPADEVQRVAECYRDDEDGLTRYVLYIKALFDDRHEYI